MEALHKGNSSYMHDNYNTAIQLYNESIAEELTFGAFVGLASAYVKLGKFDQAQEAANRAIEINPSSAIALYRRGQAKFYQNNYSVAMTDFEEAERLQESLGKVFIRKCKVEITNQVLPPGKDPYTWYQSESHIYIVLNVKARNLDETKIDISENSVCASVNTIAGAEFRIDLQLSRNIVSTESSFNVLQNKIEITLKKESNVNWTELEPQKVVDVKPSYPSSNKFKRDWNKIDKEIDQELKKHKPEGDEALQELFKQIYGNADEDTRRAMIKSFQTSGGTVLSTNWDEVKSKDYEGTDRPSPPKGQEWKKWDS